MAWLPLSPRSRVHHAFVQRWTFVLLLWSAATLGLSGGAWWLERIAVSLTPTAEEATPDCGPQATDTDPVRHRAQRLAALGVDRWHAAGIRGKGIKIAILDTGFRGYRAQLGKGLPDQVLTRCFRADGNLEARDSQHGILCGEVLHALAPEASLLLATWDPHAPEQFLQAMRWSREQGAQLVSCSVIMPSWSDAEGGGAVHAALSRILGSGTQTGDMLCFASAGNTARRHWTGAFHDGGDGYHEWRAHEADNRLRPWGVDRVSVELCCPADCRYQVQVRDATAGGEVGHATSGGSGNRGCAVVRFQPEIGHRYRVRVRWLQGPTQPFHVVALGGELDVSTARGSIPFPGDGPEVVTVGAVDEEGHRMAYSSCGPNSTQPKPDLVAPVPFATLWRDHPFTGTSAAAPQAAGLAALCWSLHPDWSATQVRAALCRSAHDLGAPGHDFETGYGLIALPPLSGQ